MLKNEINKDELFMIIRLLKRINKLERNPKAKKNRANKINAYNKLLESGTDIMAKQYISLLKLYEGGKKNERKEQ